MLIQARDSGRKCDRYTTRRAVTVEMDALRGQLARCEARLERMERLVVQLIRCGVREVAA